MSILHLKGWSSAAVLHAVLLGVLPLHVADRDLWRVENHLAVVAA